MCEKSDFQAWFNGWLIESKASNSDELCRVMEAAWLGRARIMLLPRSVRPTATFTRWLDDQHMVVQCRYRQEANTAWVARGKSRLPFVVALTAVVAGDDQRFEAYVRDFLNKPDNQPLNWSEPTVQLAWHIWQQQPGAAAQSSATA
jgi:hypothetical protein